MRGKKRRRKVGGGGGGGGEIGKRCAKEKGSKGVQRKRRWNGKEFLVNSLRFMVHGGV